MSSTCFKSEGSSSGRQLYLLLWYGNIPHNNCIYNHLPEDEPFGSKHVEDTKNQKLNYSFRKCAFHWLIMYNYITIHCARNIPFI